MKFRGIPTLALLLALINWAVPHAHAAECLSIASEFSALVQKTTFEKEIALNAGNLSDTLELLVKESGQAESANLPPLLRMALENASQHGVEDMYLPSSARIRLQVSQSEDFVEIRITNPLFKKFPERLGRAFAPGENVALSQSERPFPRGFGIGLGQMFRSFEQFPPGSAMKWAPAGDEVTFSLRIPRRP